MTKINNEWRAEMVRTFSRSFVIISLLLCWASHAYAQDPKDGEIQKVEIEIVIDKKISVPTANRSFEKVPPRPAEPIRPEIIYSLANLKFSTPDFSPVIRPLKIKAEELSKIYPNFVSAGFGNYLSPYLEGYVTSKRSKTAYYGASLYHQSYGTGPVDGGKSASGNTNAGLFGKSILNKVALDGFINYDNRGTYFYGYNPATPPGKDAIRQVYNITSLGGNIQNSKPSDFNYKLGAGFSYLSDHYKSTESETNLNFKSSYQFGTGKINLAAEYILINWQDQVQSKIRNLLKIKSFYEFDAIDKLKLRLGVNIAVENDTKSFHVYPNVSARYQLSDSWGAYAELTGDVDKVSLHTLSAENIWLNSPINIQHTNKTFDFTAGLKGNIGGKVSLGGGFAYANLKNLYYYLNNKADPSKFDVIYDGGNTSRTNLFGEVAYSQNKAFKINLRGDLFSYTTDKLIVKQPIHRPTYRVNAGTAINIYDKLVIHANFIIQGGMKAFDPRTDGSIINPQPVGIVSLMPAADLNMKVDYFLSRQVSVFLKFNNVLSSNYPLYLNYPVRGFQAIGGLSWSF